MKCHQTWTFLKININKYHSLNINKYHSLLIREVLQVGVYFLLEHLQSDQVFRREGGGVYLVGSLHELLAFHLPIKHTHTHTHTHTDH